MSQEASLKIVARALDAAIDATLWHEVCDLISDGFSLRGSAIGATDPADSIPLGVGLSGSMRNAWPGLYQLMQEGAVRDDEPCNKAVEDSRAHTLLSEWDMLNLTRGEPLPESRIRSFLQREIGMAERLGMKLNDYGPGHEILILYTGQDKPVLSKSDEALLMLTAPIISQSIRMMRIFDRLKQRFNATLGALDKLGIAAILVDRRAQVIHANAKAKGILSVGDAIRRDASGRLVTRKEDSTRKLLKACESAFATAVGKDLHAQSVLSVERDDMTRPAYLVNVSAVADPLGELELDFRSALVFIVDPEDSDALSSAGIEAMGLLTAAENAVADLLVHGATTREIAERRSVSEETVRRQIKSIMAKLNCRSRSDVIRLALATRLPLAK